MPDIVFKCPKCSKHLVADDSAAGATVECPGCNASTIIPKMVIVHDCESCEQKFKFAPEVKGEIIHCPSCDTELLVPGGSNTPLARQEQLVTFTCPECKAELEGPEETSAKRTECPNCRAEVYLRRKLGLRAPAVPPPRPCPFCGEEIQAAAIVCKHCGSALSGEQPQQHIQSPTYNQKAELPVLWNPRAAANWSILFSPAFGAWLHAQNWEELGEPEKARKCRAWFWVGLISILAWNLMNMIPAPQSGSEPSGIVVMIYLVLTLAGLGVLVFWYFTLGRAQINLVEGRVERAFRLSRKSSESQIRYEKRPWGKPLGIGFGCLLLLMVLHVGIAGLNDMGSTANKSAPKAVDSSATATPPSPDEVAAHLKPLILKKLREKPELATVVIDSIELVHKGGNAYEGFVNASLNGEAEKLAVEATLDGDMIGWKLKPLDTANESPGQNVPRTDATYATSASPQITQNGLQRLLTRIVLPEVTWREVDPTDGLTWLASESRRLDPEGKGVNFILATDSGKPVTLSLRSVPLSDVIKYVATLSGLDYQVETDAVVFFKPGAKPPPQQASGATGPMQDKLNRIVFPEVMAREAKMDDVLQYVSQESRHLDPKGEGVNCVLLSDSGKLITISVRNIPLGELIKFLAHLAEMAYRFESNAIVFDASPERDAGSKKSQESRANVDKSSTQHPGALPEDLRSFLAAGRPSVPVGSPPNIGFLGCFRERSFEINKDGSKYGFYVGKITSCPPGRRYSDGCGWWKEPVVLTGINLEGQPTDGRTTGIPENFVFRAVEVVKGVPCYGSKDCTLYVYRLVYDLNQYKDATAK